MNFGAISAIENKVSSDYQSSGTVPVKTIAGKLRIPGCSYIPVCAGTLQLDVAKQKCIKFTANTIY
ncbi:hypothetical protein D3C75_532540 [compost metagenome]